MQLTRTLGAAAIAVAITAGIAIGISNAQEPPPIPLPPPLNLEVTVTKVSDDLCVLAHNAREWRETHIPNGFATDDMRPGQYKLTHVAVRPNKGSALFSSLDVGQSEYQYRRGDMHNIPNGLRKIIDGMRVANTHEHHVEYGIRELRTGGRGLYHYSHKGEYSWATDADVFDVEQELNLCIERLYMAYDNNKHKRETYERLTIKQNELTLTKEQLEFVREQEARETELTIQLIALNAEILDTIITIEQTRLAGLERRAELMLEAAQKDAARWEEWMLESGNRFGDLESKYAETAKVLDAAKAQQSEYLTELQAAVDAEAANRAEYESNLQAVQSEYATIERQIEQIGAEAGVDNPTE